MDSQAGLSADYVLAEYGGLWCSQEYFRRVWNDAEQGHRREDYVRNMFNCLCSKGLFKEIGGDEKLDDKWNLKFLRESDINKQGSLDGYNPAIDVAFEYNGPYHYHVTDLYKSTAVGYSPFENVTYKIRRTYDKDNDKYTQFAQSRGGNPDRLIIIPYTIHTDFLKDYIASELSRLGVLQAGIDYTSLEHVEPPTNTLLNDIEQITKLYNEELPTKVAPRDILINVISKVVKENDKLIEKEKIKAYNALARYYGEPHYYSLPPEKFPPKEFARKISGPVTPPLTPPASPPHPSMFTSPTIIRKTSEPLFIPPAPSQSAAISLPRASSMSAASPEFIPAAMKLPSSSSPTLSYQHRPAAYPLFVPPQ